MLQRFLFLCTLPTQYQIFEGPIIELLLGGSAEDIRHDIEVVRGEGAKLCLQFYNLNRYSDVTRSQVPRVIFPEKPLTLVHLSVK